MSMKLKERFENPEKKIFNDGLLPWDPITGKCIENPVEEIEEDDGLVPWNPTPEMRKAADEALASFLE